MKTRTEKSDVNPKHITHNQKNYREICDGHGSADVISVHYHTGQTSFDQSGSLGLELVIDSLPDVTYSSRSIVGIPVTLFGSPDGQISAPNNLLRGCLMRSIKLKADFAMVSKISFTPNALTAITLFLPAFVLILFGEARLGDDAERVFVPTINGLPNSF